jgi:excinuclease ABC subunit A
VQRWAQSFTNKSVCPSCNGTRLKKEALFFKILNKNIGEISAMDFSELANWLNDLREQLNENQQIIGGEILKEIDNRLRFILDVGLEYLTLNRPSKSLSGGEAQRIRLATQIGTELMNVLYILDEPSIGLHQRDNTRLIQSLQRLRDVGNSVIVVEHDKEMMEAADFIVEIGPKAGIHGGEIVQADILQNVIRKGSITSDYLGGKIKIPIPEKRRDGNGQWINGPDLEVYNFSREPIVVTFEESGQTIGSFEKIASFTLQPKQTKFLTVKTIPSKIDDFRPSAGVTLLGDTEYKGSLTVKSEKSNVTVSVSIQKQVGTSWSG